MTMDQQHRQLGAVGFDHMQYSGPGPQFTNPWASTSSANSTHIFSTALGSNNNGFEALAKQQAARASGVSMPYTSATSAPSMGTAGSYSSGTYGQELLNLSQDLSNAPRSTYDQAYSAAPASSTNSYAPISAPYNLGTYTNLSQHQQQNHARRVSPQ